MNEAASVNSPPLTEESTETLDKTYMSNENEITVHDDDTEAPYWFREIRDEVRSQLPHHPFRTSVPLCFIPTDIYLFKVRNGNRTMCEICSMLTRKASERHHRCCSGVFIVNFEHNISHIDLVFSLLTLNRWIPADITSQYCWDKAEHYFELCLFQETGSQFSNILPKAFKGAVKRAEPC